MLSRLIRKFILACSSALAIALIALALCSRRGDLVISSARSGIYHELRSDRGHIRFTQISGWSKDQKVRWGRAPLPASLALDDYAYVPTIVLLDKTPVALTPNPKGWWPPLKNSGSAIMSDPSTALAKLPGGTFTGIQASNLIIAQPSGTMPIPATRPNTSLTRVPTTTPGMFSYAGGGTLVVSGNLKGAPATTSSISWTGSLIIMAKPYTYEQYAISHAAAIAIVLVPVWIALAMALLRWRRRKIRRERGLCVMCGYDLRGNPNGTCPECGRLAMS